jgi:ribosomal protein S18 acetylase RimI-like enzyme
LFADGGAMTIGIELRPMTAADYDAVIDLWRCSEGVGLGTSDTQEGIEAYLIRNPGLSQVAVAEDRIVGAVLCGHDGRRGLLYHLAVDRAYRGRGLGRRMAEKALALLREQGIHKSYIMVFHQNEEGRAFWERTGWETRTDLIPMSVPLETR